MAMPDGLVPTAYVVAPGAVTVRVLCSVTLDDAVIVMVTVPGPTAVTRPLLLTVATDVLDELHETDEFTLLITPLECEPVASNCITVPTPKLILFGVKERDST